MQNIDYIVVSSVYTTILRFWSNCLVHVYKNKVLEGNQIRSALYICS